MKDLTAAVGELNGESSGRANGAPGAMPTRFGTPRRGPLIAIGAINRKLAHPKMGTADRELLVADLRQTSRMLDFSEQFVPRIK
jgi:hypothetical protein